MENEKQEAKRVMFPNTMPPKGFKSYIDYVAVIKRIEWMDKELSPIKTSREFLDHRRNRLNYIHVVVIEEGYFKEVSECGRYALTYNNLGDAKYFNEYKKAKETAELWGGNVRSYEV